MSEEATKPAPVRADNVKAAAGTKRMLQHAGLSKSDRFLDIGANVCEVSNWAATEVGCCAVLAYEPFPLALEVAKPAPGVVLLPRAITSDGRDVNMKIANEAKDRGHLCSASLLRNGREANVSQTGFKAIPSDRMQAVLDEFQPPRGLCTDAEFAKLAKETLQ